MLNSAQRTLLLGAARQAITSVVREAPVPDIPQPISGAKYGGVFVTLRNGRRLRGCMGTFSMGPDVMSAVRSVACRAAADPRFRQHPLTMQELPGVVIQISMLSRPQRVDDPLSLELGRHGVLVEHPQGRGCFLPQVALEFGWSKEEFLRRCCRDKARLPEDGWRDPRTRVYLFSAEVFQEGEAGDATLSGPAQATPPRPLGH